MSDPHPCVAVPPDQATPGAYCVCCGKPTRVPDVRTGSQTQVDTAAAVSHAANDFRRTDK